MKQSRPDLEALGAWLDGELPAVPAAAVARAVAQDRAVAEQVAQLARLKAVLAGERAAPPIVLPPQRRPLLGPRRRPLALAAAVALVLLAGAPVWLLGHGPEPTAPPAFVTVRHQAWAQGAGQPPPAAGMVLAALQGFGRPAHIPDLAPAGLALAGVALLDEAGQPALHAFYLGSRGCRLSLFIHGPAGLPETPRAFGADGSRGYAWRSGGVGYALLASGMEPARLELVAREVASATLEKAPFDAETRMALADSRAASAPCSG
ncbi:hypothetical protein SH611_05945 [Geminicoccaceae bacterium 1502E]|nr:hypothetical protein [Geminicoccaceae bacterium 1502E]